MRARLPVGPARGACACARAGLRAHSCPYPLLQRRALHQPVQYPPVYPPVPQWKRLLRCHPGVVARASGHDITRADECSVDIIASTDTWRSASTYPIYSPSQTLTPVYTTIAMADIMNPQQEQQPRYAASDASTERDEAQVKADNELAERLSRIIEDGPSSVSSCHSQRSSLTRCI